MSATKTKQPPRRLSEEERCKRLETRVLNRVKAWDAKTAEHHRRDVVEQLEDRIYDLERLAPDGEIPQDASTDVRVLIVKTRNDMYRLWMELEAIRRRADDAR
jgi:hypothetical protein